MATKKSGQDKNHHMEEAMALLIQNQAIFLGRFSEVEQRFARIEQRFIQIEEHFQ